MGSIEAGPAAILEPRTTAEVVDAVESAAARNQPVRVVGAGGAWSPLVPTEGLLISMRCMNAVREVDRERCRITVEAGAMLLDLVELAARHGMSVKSPAMFLGLSVGGLIGTGSHGSGRHAATMGDAVVAFELVTPSGDVLHVDQPGSDLWRAAITHLGTLGVLTAVTLQCEPLYNVLEVHRTVPVEDVPGLLPDILSEQEFVSIFWYPSSDEALFKLGNRSTLPAEPMRGRIRPTLYKRTPAWLGPIVAQIAARIPAVANPVSKLINSHIGGDSRVVSEPFFSHYQQVYPTVTACESGIPVENAPEAWRWLQGRLRAYWKSGLRPVDMIVHARFCGPSRALLASSAGRATCHIEVLSYVANSHRQLFLPEFDEKMRTAFAGRPHWGKEIVNPWRVVNTHDAANLELFLDIREQLDPHQRFLNRYLRDDIFALARRRRGLRAA
jgi:L-gulonolactone oxidase